MTFGRRGGARELQDSLGRILDEAIRRLRSDRQTRRRLPGGGKLFMDGRTPFVAVYRAPRNRPDPGTVQVATSLRSYLIVPRENEPLARRVCEMLSGAIVKELGAALLIEIWSASGSGDDGVVAPVVRLHARDPDGELALDFSEALRGIQIVPPDETPHGDERATVEVMASPSAAPPEEVSLVPFGAPPEIEWIGLELPPTFRVPGTETVLPERLFLLRRSLSTALERALYAWWSRADRRELAADHHAFGQRKLGRSARAIDARLVDVAEAFDLVLGVSPVNGAAMWAEFQSGKMERTPRFQYRPLRFDPEALKRSLFHVPLERIEDPLVSELIREKQEELDLRITMLHMRGREEFFHGSIQLFGKPDPTLVELARQVLDLVPPTARDEDPPAPGTDDALSAREFAEMAHAELERYGKAHPDFPRQIEIRDDIASGLLVSAGTLYVNASLRIERRRAEALIQHEVGTHLLTFFNGGRQPLRLLAAGLAHYGALQEGLAVLAEYLVGGLTCSRVRTVAARVLAVQARVEGAGFVEAHRSLVELGFGARAAFLVVVRVYRGGGFTKDMQYLQGLRDLLRYLGAGGRTETLFVGKIGLAHIDIVRQLEVRGILNPPALRPRYAEDGEAMERIERCRNRTVIDIVREARP